MEVGCHPFTVNQEDNQNSPENSDESPTSPVFHATSATSSPKRRRGTQKRIVHVPIKDVEGSRLKGDQTNAPPSDSWAWRKYGQKPIKGSPYPRGYYKCSSSKGCPARKQVERNRTDPTMVMVTYSCKHNHPGPASRNHNNHHLSPPSSPPILDTKPNNININNDDQYLEQEPSIQTRQTELELEPEPEPESDQKFTSLEVGSCGPFASTTDQYGWFSDLDSTSSAMLESPFIMAGDTVEDSDMTTIFSIREDEESFFADLGELPECATVFRRREIERVEEHRRNLAPWCGTTG